MSPPIDVEPVVFDAASKVFGQTVASWISSASKDLGGALAGTGAMAGSDPGGVKWAGSYDPAVTATLGAMTDLTNACYQLAGMLELTGFNHGMAESASDPTRSAPTPADRTNYRSQTAAPPPNPPSANGGSGSAPNGWGLIESAVGYVWPNGDPGKLRAAATAWTAAADSLDFASYDVDGAVTAVQSQTSPEVADATTVCRSMKGHIADVASSCRALSSGCTQLAGYIDKAHKDVEDELISLVEWTVAIEAGGAVVGFLTAGIGEVGAQAAEAGRIAATAARVGSIISHLIEMAGTVAETVSAVVARVAGVCQRLKAILGARLTVATSELVSRLPGLGKTAEALAERGLQVSAESSAADDALYQAYRARKAAAGARPLSREAWDKRLATLRTNKATGDAYRDQVAQDLGITPGKGGWETEYTRPNSGRRFDIANPASQTAIEVKSGSTPTAEGLAQLAKDEQAIRDGWTITWQLKTDLSPTLMARLQELASRYPNGFHYTVAGR